MIDGRYVYANGRQAWYVDGQLHRVDGPAIIGADGSQTWYVDGQRHRTDGPAIIGADGRQAYWIYGKDIAQEVAAWISIHNVTWPFDDNTRIQFILTFGGR